MCPGTTCPGTTCPGTCPAADPLESDGEAETEAVGGVEAGEAESERYVM